MHLGRVGGHVLSAFGRASMHRLVARTGHRGHFCLPSSSTSNPVTRVSNGGMGVLINLTAATNA